MTDTLQVDQRADRIGVLDSQHVLDSQRLERQRREQP